MSEKNSQPTPDQEKDSNASEGMSFLLEMHCRLLELKTSELRMFWQRAVIFLTMMSLLFTGYVYMRMEKGCDYSVELLLCTMLGVIFSFLWMFLLKASKHWLTIYKTALKKFVGMFFTRGEIGEVIGSQRSEKWEELLVRISQPVKDNTNKSKGSISWYLSDWNNYENNISTSSAFIYLAQVMVITWTALFLRHVIPWSEVCKFRDLAVDFKVGLPIVLLIGIVLHMRNKIENEEGIVIDGFYKDNESPENSGSTPTSPTASRGVAAKSAKV